MELPNQPIHRIIKKESKLKVSQEASSVLGKELELNAQAIASKAKELAERDERKTVTKKDIRNAIKHINEVQHQ